LSVDVDRLLKEAGKWGKLSVEGHLHYRGKIEVVPKCAIRGLSDFSIWYTPGVAEACREIQKDLNNAYDYTGKWNFLAVVTDGTRVLGLGDIGGQSGMPVMEGKALIFKYLGGIDAFPICLATKDADEIITAVKWIQPTFGGINLEDIASPKCFYVLDRLRREMEIPVWHDDQQGTATVMLAGLVNALKVAGKKLDQITLSLIGAGAANARTAYVLMKAGVKPGNIFITDSKGILHTGRKELEGTYKWDLCLQTNSEGKTGDNAAAIKDTDVCFALSTPGPGVIKKEWISKMNDKSIVFACANPIPEIWPWEAMEGGAYIVGTGRSDFPNQVNNSLVFPAIFRGALDVRSKTITDDMCIADAFELAKHAEEKGLSQDYILPSMDDWEIYPRQAVATATKAMEQGIARQHLTRKQVRDRATTIIRRSQEMIKALMEKGYIPKMPENL